MTEYEARVAGLFAESDNLPRLIADALKEERARCAAIVRAKKPIEPRLWWLSDELESLATEIEKTP